MGIEARTAFTPLLRLFWQHLVRRKSLWVIVAVAGAMLLIGLVVQSQMDEWVEQGVRYDVATRRAAAQLESYANEIRQVAILFALVVGALVAPASRKEGTTQFALSLSVPRLRLAQAQFGAVAVFVVVAAVVVHVGHAIAAHRLGVARLAETAFAWIMLALPLVVLAATSFSLSLTRPALVVYGVLLGIPNIALPLLAHWITSWKTAVPQGLRLLAARTVDNLALLFPDVGSLVVWPRLWPAIPDRPPFPSWGWEVAHQVCVAALWIVAGLWAYRRYDIGSRTPTR